MAQSRGIIKVTDTIHWIQNGTLSDPKGRVPFTTPRLPHPRAPEMRGEKLKGEVLLMYQVIAWSCKKLVGML